MIINQIKIDEIQVTEIDENINPCKEEAIFLNQVVGDIQAMNNALQDSFGCDLSVLFGIQNGIYLYDKTKIPIKIILLNMLRSQNSSGVTH